jgi:hypothetical protein
LAFVPCIMYSLLSRPINAKHIHMVIKKSLCTWWLQYRKLFGLIWLLSSWPPGSGGH